MAAGDLTATVATLGNKPCAVFDGVDDYVEVPHDSSQLGANLSNGFTISAWINPISLGESTGRILDKSSDATIGNGFAFYLRTDNPGGTFAIIINNGTPATSSSGSIVYGSNIWYHILVTVSSAQLANMYKNGVLSGVANQNLVQTISTITTTNAMRIGNRSGATDRSFDGGIREVKMWKKVLSSTEIADDYAGKSTATGDLILYVPLKEDYTEKKQGLTLTNSGSYLTTTPRVDIKTNVDTLNLAAVTDNLIIVPSMGKGNAIHVIGVNRSA